jgi:glutaconyl-CoA/methylmalonyl-CoA decarboxylase subunit gamma
MNNYQITVNGNTYSVTVKSIVGKRAVVDVDGWEFEVNIGEGSIPAAAPKIAVAASAAVQAAPKPAAVKPAPPKEEPKKRTSMIDTVATKKPVGLDSTSKGVVAAHLPGLILEIDVKPGQKVKEGDLLIKMEAMKMVNEIRAKHPGTVKDIFVALQQNVLENQPLLIIE